MGVDRPLSPPPDPLANRGRRGAHQGFEGGQGRGHLRVVREVAPTPPPHCHQHQAPTVSPAGHAGGVGARAAARRRTSAVPLWGDGRGPRSRTTGGETAAAGDVSGSGPGGGAGGGTSGTIVFNYRLKIQDGRQRPATTTNSTGKSPRITPPPKKTPRLGHERLLVGGRCGGCLAPGVSNGRWRGGLIIKISAQGGSVPRQAPRSQLRVPSFLYGNRNKT